MSLISCFQGKFRDGSVTQRGLEVIQDLAEEIFAVSLQALQRS